MRVMLVDDHPLVRNGIASLLQARGHQVVAEASNGREALDRLGNITPDLIIMDIRMPEVNGLEATRLIKARHPDIKIVMLTVSDEEHDLFEAIKSGADSYLLKDLQAAQFFEALESIQKGEAVVPVRLAGRLLEEFRSQAQRVGMDSAASTTPDPRLSLREQEVLMLVAQGLTNKEVAARLHVSDNTVKYHMKSILDKLHLQNRSQVITWAARQRGSPGPKDGAES